MGFRALACRKSRPKAFMSLCVAACMLPAGGSAAAPWKPFSLGKTETPGFSCRTAELLEEKDRTRYRTRKREEPTLKDRERLDRERAWDMLRNLEIDLYPYPSRPPDPPPRDDSSDSSGSSREGRLP